jgi:hypothetical protein
VLQGELGLMLALAPDAPHRATHGRRPEDGAVTSRRAVREANAAGGTPGQRRPAPGARSLAPARPASGWSPGETQERRDRVL